jgi:hypothetical protein
VSVHQEQARDLIDLVADAMDAHESRKAQYDAGRRIVLAYHQMNPHQHFAFHQASLYVARRLDLETV